MSSNEPNTTVERVHKPCGYAYKVVTEYGSYDKPVQVYRGEDAAQRFILNMHEEYEAVKDLLYMDTSMTPLTSTQKKEHDEAKSCYMCEEPFVFADDKVHDHCHYRYEMF